MWNACGTLITSVSKNPFWRKNPLSNSKTVFIFKYFPVNYFHLKTIKQKWLYHWNREFFNSSVENQNTFLIFRQKLLQLSPLKLHSFSQSTASHKTNSVFPTKDQKRRVFKCCSHLHLMIFKYIEHLFRKSQKSSTFKSFVIKFEPRRIFMSGLQLEIVARLSFWEHSWELMAMILSTYKCEQCIVWHQIPFFCWSD